MLRQCAASMRLFTCFAATERLPKGYWMAIARTIFWNAYSRLYRSRLHFLQLNAYFQYYFATCFKIYKFCTLLQRFSLRQSAKNIKILENVLQSPNSFYVFRSQIRRYVVDVDDFCRNAANCWDIVYSNVVCFKRVTFPFKKNIIVMVTIGEKQHVG